jgi:hypothetical protein
VLELIGCEDSILRWHVLLCLSCSAGKAVLLWSCLLQAGRMGKRFRPGQTHPAYWASEQHPVMPLGTLRLLCLGCPSTW